MPINWKHTITRLFTNPALTLIDIAAAQNGYSYGRWRTSDM